MEVSARLSHARISARKVRLVADRIRGLPVEDAQNVLKFSNKKAAAIISKVLESATSNAEHNESVDIDDLRVASIYVDEGRTVKRFHARAKGRASQILKRSAHIKIIVAD